VAVHTKIKHIAHGALALFPDDSAFCLTEISIQNVKLAALADILLKNITKIFFFKFICISEKQQAIRVFPCKKVYLKKKLIMS
jgi:hypothetical protein